METKKIKIEYDTRPEDFIDMVTGMLNTLGVKYEMTGEDVITIEYEVERK